MGHRRLGGGHHGSYRPLRPYNQSPGYPPAGGGAGPRRPKPIAWILAVVALTLWSFLAWVAYVSADPVLGWLGGNADLVGQGAKGAATAAGAGGKVDVGVFFGQTVAFLQRVAKPAIISIWAIGGLGVLAAPLALPWIMRLRRRLHR